MGNLIMRFYSTSTPPIIGSHRVIIKFLFLPKKLNNEKRWLEFSIIKQRYVKWQKNYMKAGEVVVKDVQEWVDVGWGE